MSSARNALSLLVALAAAQFSLCLAWSFPTHQSPSVLEQESPPSFSHLTRREFIPGILGSVCLSARPDISIAAAPLDAGEAIRRSAANIPGYGQTDVFFPESLAGSWIMKREVDFGGKEPLHLYYPFRFIRSIEDNAVVMDRGINQAELEKAVVRSVTGKDDGTSNVRSYEWLQNNPNDLKLVLSDGSKKEIKVTKRATEKTDSTVSSSEFQRVLQEDGRGIPVISARRVMTKWKIVDKNTVEGLEVVYSMAGGDPMAPTPAGGSASPSILSKSRLQLTR